jgi:hypothetical protein
MRTVKRADYLFSGGLNLMPNPAVGIVPPNRSVSISLPARCRHHAKPIPGFSVSIHRQLHE